MSDRNLPAALRPPLGWPLLPRPDASGALRWSGLAENVAQHLRHLLATLPGELQAHPRYGAGLQRALHESDSLATRARLREWVEEAVARWEPRVTLERVELEDEGSPDQGALRLQIVYRLRRDGTRAGLSATLRLGD